MKDYGLLIIDMQKDFVLPGAPACIAGAFDTVPVIARALDFFRQKGRPVFHVVREHRADGSDVESIRLDRFLDNHACAVAGTPGCEIVDPLVPLPGEYRIVKKRFSAFMNTELDFMLRRLGISHLAVCGTQYPTCVRCTIFDAAAYGYQVTLLTDAASAQTPAIAEANIRDIQNLGVTCLTTGRFIQLHQAGNRDL
jgi:nicotinamidase-related amidase